MKTTRFFSNLASIFALGLLFAAPAWAATFTVTVFTDTAAFTTVAAAGDGPGNAGDLRHAILAANAAGGTNTITFSGTFPQTITLGGPLPPIASSLTIDGGTYGNVIIDGAGLYRVFFVDTGTVILENLRIQNALAKGGNGADGGGGGAGLGAGLFVNQAGANVTVTNVLFANCAAVGGNGGAYTANGTGGGGGLVFSGGSGAVGGSSAVVGGGGGGIQGSGTNGVSGGGGGGGGTGGGGGGGGGGHGNANGGGGGAYDTANATGNAAGNNGLNTVGGGGGLGGGGGGGSNLGGAGGFGGGGGGGGNGGGAGGFGGGGGVGGIGGGSSLADGGTGGTGGSGVGGGGGGGAVGPAIFVLAGTLTTANSGADSATNTGGSGAGTGSNGTADSTNTPVYNYGGTVNSSATTGPITGTLSVGPRTPTYFSVSVSPGTATSYVTHTTVTVTALDQFNDTATAYAGTVDLTSTDPGIVFTPTSGTLTGGTGTFDAVFKQAGNQTVTATDSVASSITGTSNTVTVDPGTAVRLVISGPGTATAGVSFSFTVTAQDLYGNTATGYAGTVHFTSSDGAASLPADSTLTAGSGSFNATLSTAGSRTITATDTVSSSITGTSGSIAVSASVATHFSVAAPSTATAGSAFSYTVTALDAYGNIATGYAGTVHFTSSDPAAALPANSTLTAGSGSFNATLSTAGSRTLTATDTVSSSITGTSGSIAVSANAATHFSVAAPSTATAGSAFAYTVTALDVGGNIARGYTGTVHFTSTDPAAALPGNSTLTAGSGSFNVTLNTTGSRTITATDTVSGSIAGTSGSIAVSPSAATHFSVAAPSTATAGLAFSYTVTALDAYGNTVAGYAGTVHFTSTDPAAALPGNSTLTAGSGSFNVTLNTTGSRTVTATDTVSSSITGTSGSIAVSTNAATHFSVAAPSTATAGSAFAYTVTALDVGGNIARGYTGTVHFTSSDGNSSLPADSTLIAGSGTFNATLNTPGARTITGTDTVIHSITGTSGAITVTASAPATAISSATTASGTYGQTFGGYTITASNSPTSFGSSVLPSGLTLNTGTGAITGTPTQAGTFNVTIYAFGGTGGTAEANLTITIAKASQTISFSQAAVLSNAAPFALQASASSNLPVTFTLLGGPASLSGSTVTLTDSPGIVTVEADQAGNADYLAAPTVTVTFNVMLPAPLINVSILSQVGPAQSAFVAGFVIVGNGPKPVLLRAVGPSLASFGVTGPLAAPMLQLYDGNGNLVLSNSGWGGSSTLSALFAQVGAFQLNAGSADAAATIMLSPGIYTMVVSGIGGATGTALAEVYDASASPLTQTSALINVSSLGLVRPGSSMTAGFVIGGSTPKQVLIRGVGPSLAPFGITNALSAATLGVYAPGGAFIAQNQGWGTPMTVNSSYPGAGAAAISAAASASGAFNLAAGSADSAVLVTLPPGPYTAQVSAGGSASGTALIEVYLVP